MTFLLLGVGIGLLTLMAPGPVNIALVQVGARRGVRPAMQGAVGIMGGDSLLGVIALMLLAVGTALPTAVFSATQVGAAVLLVVLGALLIARPAVTAAPLQRLQRPTRTFFLLTSLTPSALGGWIAMLAAMPFADNVAQLTLFAAGAILASYLWHPVLGLLAGKLGSRLTERGQLWLSRAGGAGMGAVGAALLVAAG